MCPYASHIPEPPLAAVQIEAEEASSGTCMTPSMPTVRHAGHDGVASRMAFREPGREHDGKQKAEGHAASASSGIGPRPTCGIVPGR